MQVAATSRRSEGRYQINSRATHVTLSFAQSDGEPRHIHGQLADLSLHGVKISVDGRVERGTHVELEISIPSMDFTMKRNAVVRWQQPRDGSTWWTGCELSESITEEVVDDLANADVLNRRRDPRYDVDVPAKVRWELSDVCVDGRVLNFSKGGFCFSLQERVEFPSDRLMLEVNLGGRTVPIPARVMWQRCDGGEAIAGCAFATMDGFLKLRDYAKPDLAEQQRLARDWYRPRLSKWVPIALIVAAISHFVFLLVAEPNLLKTAPQRWRQMLFGASEVTIPDTLPVTTPPPADEPVFEEVLPADDVVTPEVAPVPPETSTNEPFPQVELPITEQVFDPIL